MVEKSFSPFQKKKKDENCCNAFQVYHFLAEVGNNSFIYTNNVKCSIKPYH